ncbi:DUF2490 domain-containing protein [Sphingobacterium oryzagri]|uniref:DUF2490 domain-containing protein n=1 Tax=Sphingobacterium oryzagri TaxID=3025669 RepID=A0ABY7WLT8_9SPHI|nr:DUF2490 domain-containing protein [Sphingobacterium sp. KACC 22765]WDF68294.1 DUF2490 domain-containing protein [Sphingobacterium sp. KACC 22765]
MFYRVRLIVTLIIVLFALKSRAQHLQGWGIYFGSTTLKDRRFSLQHELQLRDYKLVGDHQQTLLRLGLQYQATSSVSFTLGYGYIYNEWEDTPNNPFSENRIYQEALIRHSWNILRIRHRFRTEERFTGNGFRGRARYCLFVDVPLTARQMQQGGLYFAAYDELFVNVLAPQTSLFDRNRLYGGLGLKVRDNLGVQLGYMRQHVGALPGTNHVLLSFHHQLKL